MLASQSPAPRARREDRQSQMGKRNKMSGEFLATELLEPGARDIRIIPSAYDLCLFPNFGI